MYETGILKPLLQLGLGTDLPTGLLERAVDFIEVLPSETGAVETVIFRVGVAVPVLEFNPAAGLHGTVFR